MVICLENICAQALLLTCCVLMGPSSQPATMQMLSATIKTKPSAINANRENYMFQREERREKENERERKREGERRREERNDYYPERR